MAQEQTSGIDQTRVARDTWVRFKTACEDGDHAKFVESAIKHDNYYQGDQWSERDRKKLEDVGRPALTINKILPTVNTMCGEQISKRMSIAYTPLRNATAQSAHAMSKLAMHILRENLYHWKESEVYLDGTITGRGFFDIRMNFETNPLGDIRIDTEHYAEVVPDPAARDFDPATWNEGYVIRWRTLDQIEAEYGEEKRKAVEDAGYQNLLPSECVKWGKLGTYGYGNDPFGLSQLLNGEDPKRSLLEAMLVERQYVRMVRRHYLVDATGKRRPLPFGTKDAEAKDLAARFGTMLFTGHERRIWWTVVVGDRIVLHDTWSPYRSFTFIPYFAYFRRGKSFGAVKNLVSPQDQFNKLSSQELHIVNTTANSGWIVEDGSLTNMTPDDLREEGATTGLVIVKAPGRASPEKIKPNQVPTGIDRISMKAEAHIKEISMVSDAMLGFESPEVSGVVLENKENRGQIGMISTQDNLARTRYLVARKIKELIQDFVTERRAVLLVSELDTNETEELIVNDTQPDGTVVNNVTTGEFDIEISSIPANETYQDQQFAQMVNLRQLGAPIPWYRVIQSSRLEERATLAGEVQSLEGLSPPTEEESQIAQFVQQINLNRQELELQQLAGEIQLLESQVQLNMAKAQQAGTKPTMEMHHLESTLAIKREEFNLRRQLAALSSISKLDAIKAQGREINKQQIIDHLTQPKKGATTNGQ